MIVEDNIKKICRNGSRSEYIMGDWKLLLETLCLLISTIQEIKKFF